MKHMAQRFIGEWNKGKAAAMAAVDKYCSADCVYHGSAGDIRGLDKVKQYYSQLFDATPDGRITLDDMIVEGDRIAIRYTSTGTQTGPFMGIPATNKKFTIWVIEIDRVKGGKFVEAWVRSDMLSLMQQIGVMPMPGKQK